MRLRRIVGFFAVWWRLWTCTSGEWPGRWRLIARWRWTTHEWSAHFHYGRDYRS